MSLFLIDGSNVLHKSVFSSVNMDNEAFCILRFLKYLSDILEEYGESKENILVVSWDLGIPLFRRKLWRNYKPNKKPYSWFLEDFLPEKATSEDQKSFPDENILEKYSKYRKILHGKILPSLGILSLAVPDVEADDIIAFLVRKNNKEFKIMINSTDRDLNQLLGNSVSQVSDREEITLSKVIERDGLSQDTWRTELLLRKSILGDKADNIPKLCRGIGEKKVTKICKEIMKTLGPNFPIGESTDDKEQLFPGIFKGDLVRNYKLIDLDYPVLAKEEVGIDIEEEIRKSIPRAMIDKKLDTWTIQDMISEEGIRSYMILESIEKILDLTSSGEKKVLY